MTDDARPLRETLRGQDGSATPRRGSLVHASFDLRMAAADELHAQGWTLNNAMDHLEGSCDPAVCCGQWPASHRGVVIQGMEYPL